MTNKKLSTQLEYWRAERPSEWLIDEVKKLEQDNYRLRMMLFMQHSHNGSSACLYGDDGERVCNECGVDFVRDSVQMIRDKTYTYSMNELVRLGVIKRVLQDGVPCEHQGCLNHITHPCEGCGRIGGVTVDNSQQPKI